MGLPSKWRSTPSPLPAILAHAPCFFTAALNSPKRVSKLARGSSILSTHASLSADTTRIASVRPFKNLRVVAASYVPPCLFCPSDLSSRAYASWTTICAHPVLVRADVRRPVPVPATSCRQPFVSTDAPGTP